MKMDAPGIFSFFGNVTRGVETNHSSRTEKACIPIASENGDTRDVATYNESIQFHPAGAPVPLSVD